MSEEASLPHHSYRNFRIPINAKEEYFDAAVDYAPLPNDIFIVSYPKCGTTWTQHIVYLLHTHGVPADDINQVMSSVPFPEQDGFPVNTENIMALKYHLPFNLMPYSEHARYIYIARNPKDACVSYYHFLRNLPGYKIKNIEEFIAAFISGNISYGDILDHFQSWYDVRSRPNVLFLLYEDLSSDRHKSILQIAKFLGFKDLPPNVINAVENYSSFKFMKNLAEKNSNMEKYLATSTYDHNGIEPGKKPLMMRKGVVGDWKNSFSVAQSQKMDEYLNCRLKQTDLLKLWM